MSRLKVMLFVVCSAAIVQVSFHTWDWFRHREQRAELVVLRERVVDAGAAMVVEQLEAERLQALLAEDDRILAAKRSLVDSYGRFARRDTLPGHLYGSYREDLDALTTRTLERNARLAELRDALARRSAAAHRYQSLSDSLRFLATEAGDPFYPVPIPSEAATERGVSPHRYN